MVSRSVALAALVAAGAAQAQSPMDRLFPGPEACYARDYTEAHLASHPMQQATSLALTPSPRRPGDRFQDLRLTATVRAMPGEVLTALAYCENIDETLFCAMEGDAGGFTLRAADGGAVLVEVTRLGMTFEGMRGFVTFAHDRGDDRSFLLRPVRDCR
jgi:hypothetical protein